MNTSALLQFLKFGIVGASNTLIYLLVYYIFLFIDDSLYIAGNMAGWLISVFNAWFWSRRYVFRKEAQGGALKELFRSYVSYGATFLLSTVLLWIEVEHLNISSVIAPILTLFVTVPLNFFINKYWTFR